MLIVVLWSIVCLFAVGLVIGSVRGRKPISRVLTDVLLLALWLVVGASLLFEDAIDDETVLLAALIAAGCYAVLRVAVRAGLLE
ncbi:hypothetical protein [Natronobeatus ordinarius]|uniref:hypothetical protein n=1 Tax=Natronobeatus ordinarius TaxID=2963433 RepID=UPI0020CE80B2|nr:hypothetical protein [Natronobeatus ordinarius]